MSDLRTSLQSALAPLYYAGLHGAKTGRPYRGCSLPAKDIPYLLDDDSSSVNIRIMKTTVDIPDDELEDVMRFTRATTKREAIVTAITDFNRRRRMAELAKRAGTCADFMTVDELQRARRNE